MNDNILRYIFITCVSCVVILFIWTVAQQVQISQQKRELAFTQKEVAVQYLTVNDVWHKSEMECFSELKGLYEDLNYYRYHELEQRQKRAPYLKRSSKWNEIMNAYSTVSEYGLAGMPNYARDGYITVKQYVRTIHEKDSIERRIHDSDLAVHYLKLHKEWERAVLTKEFLCTKGLWPLLEQMDFRSISSFMQEHYELRAAYQLKKIDSLGTLIIKNEPNYAPLRENVRRSGIIKGGVLIVDQYITALEEYNTVIASPYSRSRRKDSFFNEYVH